MRLLIADHLANAYESLRSNRTRSLLTGLGVAIGVASITAVLALSAGLSGVIGKQIKALEGNIAVIRPSSFGADTITQQQSFASSTLTKADYEVVKSIKGIGRVAPLMIINGSSSKGDRRPTDSSVVATTPDLEQIANLSAKEGQFLDDVTNQQTAVLGQQLSVDLFGTEQSIGKTFTIRGQTFTVIGVLKRLNDPINFNTVDFDRTAIIHLEAGQDLLGGNAPLQQINFQAPNAKLLDDVIKQADAQIMKLHQGEKDYNVVVGSDIAKPTSRLFQALKAVAVAIAGISLVVGGVGIMNIMLVNVAERTREIGLRKAIGASNGHIIWQFLIESLIVSLAGGAAGYVLGYIMAFAISTSLPFAPGFSLGVLGLAAGLSIGVGVIFGIYPALKAASKDPIEALRHYH